MKNNVGIITIHSVYNYGAMLQAYALSTYLNKNDINAEIIDYRPYHLCKDYELYYRDIFLRPKAMLSRLKSSLFSRNRFKKFDEFFENNINCSVTKYETERQLKESLYTTLITGSDQIWNPYIINRDTNYLLGFSDNKCRKIAYSSSFGVSEIPEDWSDEISINLIQFDKIGVRENTGKLLLEEILPSKEVTQVLDPVFLLDSSHWRELASRELTPDYKYVLVYSLEVNEEMINQAKFLADEFNLKIVTIHPFLANYEFADNCINTAGPKEFISLIDNAEFVVTNSFHGTVFSLILNTNLSCKLHSKTGSRISSLLSRFEVKSNVLNIKKCNIPVLEMDESSNTLMNETIDACKKFLLGCFNT